MRRKRLKRKFKIGLAVLFVLFLSGLIPVIRYGDVNLTESVVGFSSRTEAKGILGGEATVYSDSRFIETYGNWPYYILFLGFLLYGFFGRKNPGKKKYLRVSLIYLLVQLVASGIITQGLKYAVGRPRPSQARSEGHLRKPFHTSMRYRSFPSGHSADAFSSAGVLWMFSSSPEVMGLSFAYSCMVALSRVTADRHFFLDILAGTVIGFSVALILMYKKYEEDGG